MHSEYSTTIRTPCLTEYVNKINYGWFASVICKSSPFFLPYSQICVCVAWFLDAVWIFFPSTNIDLCAKYAIIGFMINCQRFYLLYHDVAIDRNFQLIISVKWHIERKISHTPYGHYTFALQPINFPLKSLDCVIGSSAHRKSERFSSVLPLNSANHMNDGDNGTVQMWPGWICV